MDATWGFHHTKKRWLLLPVTRAESLVFGRKYPVRCFQKDIEKHFFITRSTASSVLGRMEQKELVRRLAVERDARLKKVILTDQSRAIYRLMAEDSEKLEKVLMTGFARDKIETLCSYLARMKTNLSDLQQKN